MRAQLSARGLAPKTVAQYAAYIGRAERWFNDHHLDLARAEATDVAIYSSTLPLSWSTRSLVRCALLHYWAMAGHPAPPAQAVRVPPQPKGQCLAPEADDARVLAKAVLARGDAKALAVGLGMWAALRREEIAGLPWVALGEPGWLTVVGKGARTRRIPLHPALSGMLDAHERRGPWVFPGQAPGSHVCPATVWKWVREVSDDAGIGMLRPHLLRHLALATANDNTGDLRAVQDFAGHSKPETTARYTRTTSRRLRAVVESIDY